LRRCLITGLSLIVDPYSRAYAVCTACMCVFVIQLLFRPIASPFANGVELLTLQIIAFFSFNVASQLFLTHATGLEILMTVLMVTTIVILVIVAIVDMRHALYRVWQVLRGVARIRSNTASLTQPLLEPPSTERLAKRKSRTIPSDILQFKAYEGEHGDIQISQSLAAHGEIYTANAIEMVDELHDSQ